MRCISLLLAILSLAIFVPVAHSQVPTPPGTPTPADPKPGSVTIATVVSQSRVRALGLRVSLRMPRGSDTVQITVRRGSRVFVRALRTNPPRAFRLPETKRLRRGRYTVEIRVGTSRSNLGPASRVTVTIR